MVADTGRRRITIAATGIQHRYWPMPRPGVPTTTGDTMRNEQLQLPSCADDERTAERSRPAVPRSYVRATEGRLA